MKRTLATAILFLCSLTLSSNLAYSDEGKIKSEENTRSWNKVCSSQNSSLGCKGFEREKQLFKKGVPARREGKKLILDIERREDLVLEDGEDQEPGNSLSYFLIDYWPKRKIYVLFTQGHEFSGYQIVQRSYGMIKKMAGYPIPSSEGTYVAAFNLDLEAGYTRNGIEIVAVHAHSFTTELVHTFEGWGPIKGRWTAPDQFEFRRVRFGAKDSKGTTSPEDLSEMGYYDEGMVTVKKNDLSIWNIRTEENPKAKFLGRQSPDTTWPLSTGP